MSTWLGKWHDGGPQWQHEYLAAFEDPFDAADNAARTLGTAVSSHALVALCTVVSRDLASGACQPVHFVHHFVFPEGSDNF